MTRSRFIDAVRYATLKHANQRRKAATAKVVPYIVHPLEAAQILVEAGITDEDILIAAVLHDTLEDTDATEDDIRFKYGERVLSIVKEVTDDKELPKKKRKELQVTNAPSKSYAAKLVKAADKTSNMKDLVRNPPGWSSESVRGYAGHARRVVTALSSMQGEIPPQLVAVFWQASQEVLDWCEEQEARVVATQEATPA
ncbi:MAG: phosphohydrolase [Gammaproteobacteria bacterium]|nr:MAG: phosphohydrolase [Gammaproteobacteria bacterium]